MSLWFAFICHVPLLFPNHFLRFWGTAQSWKGPGKALMFNPQSVDFSKCGEGPFSVGIFLDHTHVCTQALHDRRCHFGLPCLEVEGLPTLVTHCILIAQCTGCVRFNSWVSSGHNSFSLPRVWSHSPLCISPSVRGMRKWSLSKKLQMLSAFKMLRVVTYISQLC